MLRWALIFFIISLVAGALGLTGIAAGARRIALVLFTIFMTIAVLVVLAAILIGQAVF